MKKIASHILILIAAIAVFFTGNGVTIVKYCCTGCAEQTSFFTQTSACCTEGHDSDQQGDPYCSTHDTVCDGLANNVSDNGDHCGASRVSVDIDATSFKPQLVLPFAWLSDSPVFTFQASPGIPTLLAHHFNNAPPIVHPRDYLSFIRILII